jgi:tetratricopeptide (TPR) repeat protein
MKRFLLCAVAGLGLTIAVSAQAQTPAQPQAQPKPKSQAEVTALQAMFGATDPDAQIAAANTVLEKFADTEFKSIALFMIASDYQRKGDFPKAVTYGERALEADPKNYQAMLVVSSEYAQNTHDTDFDRDDKLKKADKYATDAIAALKTAGKPNPNLTDAAWDGAKKDMVASADEILGQSAMVRKKPDVAATYFQAAIDNAVTKTPSTYVRLAQADNALGKYDDAIAAAEKGMNAPDAPASVKQFAQAERARAMQAKSGGAKPAAPPATPATPAPPQP